MARGRIDPDDVYDRQMLDDHAAQRDRLSREAGGIAYEPSSPDSLGTSGASSGPYVPSKLIWDQWQSIYGRMSREELEAEEEELDEEMLRLHRLSYIDEQGHGMNDMKRELVRGRLRELRGF